MKKRIDLDSPDVPPLPGIGSPVTTACKGVILFEANTPSALYRGERVYFCLTSCLNAFLDDPVTSCLAAEIKQNDQ